MLRAAGSRRLVDAVSRRRTPAPSARGAQLARSLLHMQGGCWWRAVLGGVAPCLEGAALCFESAALCFEGAALCFGGGALFFGGVAVCFACSSTEAAGAPQLAEGLPPAEGNADEDRGPGVPGDNPGAGQGSGSPGSEPAPPERELERSFFRVPVVSGNAIWSANPESGRVALIDGATRAVTTFAAGLRPTYLAALPGDGVERAIVIDPGSFDATLFRLGSDGASTLAVPVHEGANAWALGEKGRFAVAWSDAALHARLDATESLQDISVIDTSAASPSSLRFSVGYRPVQLALDAEEKRLYAVTQSGISVVELGDEPRLLPDLTLADGPGTPVLDDVPISADGRFALVRFVGSPRLDVIELESGASRTLTLPAEVTDVDLAGPGTRAVAALRATEQVATFDVLEVLDDPSAITLRTLAGAAVGSVALPDAGDAALVFTNSVPRSGLSIVGIEDGAHRALDLRAPVRAVFPAPDGSHAIALLSPTPNGERAGGFAVVPVGEPLPAKIQGTDAPPLHVSIAGTAAGLAGLVTVRDDARAIHAVYVVRMPSLQVDRFELASPPLATGILPELGQGFVAQEHPEGRITFIDFASGELQTLTGFELATRVVTGGAR